MISYTEIRSGRVKENELNLLIIKQRHSIFMIILLLGVTFATIQFASWQAMASSDQDGDGLITSIEYLLNTQIQNWDTDGDLLPDGWEWKYGLNPLSGLVGDDGQTGDPDGDQLTNLQEYNYGLPANWDNPNTPDILDNGVWWNGTVPVNNWNEEDAMQYIQPGCGDAGSDGQGGIILCDEDPVGDICSDGFDNDHDGQIDLQDSDHDGDTNCGSDDDDGDGLIDEDPYGWDTDADGLNDGWEVANGLDPTDPTGNNGGQGDPDGDGLINLYEFINPSWDTQCNSVDCFRPGPPPNPMTGTESPCNPVTGDGPNGCATLVAEVDGNTQTNPNFWDTDGDTISDGDEVSIWLTDPTEADTDGDGLHDGLEISSGYGNPPQATDPRNNNTDGDAWDDGEEDINFNGQIDGNESDPTRREDTGDFDEDGIQNWEENLTCTEWNNADTDYGGVSDGDEINPLHGTNPCDSLVDVSAIISNWGSATLTLSDASAFNPNGGKGWYQSTTGSLTEFAYATRIGNQLTNVNVAPGGGDIVLAKDGSWCRMDAESDGTIFTTRQYCDDDYYDTDLDGLADWQERTAFFGYFSNHSSADSDGDGQNDFDEVMGGTDPMIACENSLDADGDGVNDYFETTTGCNLVYIGVLSGGNDIYVTDPLIYDTDNGGVSDYQEYFDGTNPENVPEDDINPQDTDGDGIPDSIENLTGTDWRNPDTDGGGMSDYAECPPQFWATLCNGSNYDPFDPTDDVTNEDVVFWANTSSTLLDRGTPLYWRVNTYDNYTGGGYGVDVASHTPQFMSQNYLNTTWIADSAYSNGTVTWTMAYNSPISNGLSVPMPHNWEALDIWTDPTAKLERWDGVNTVTAEGSPLNELTTQAKQLWYEPADLVDSEPHVPSALELNLPSYFTDGVSNESIVDTITQEVISGETTGFGMANAIADHLRQGNASLFYQINFNGSGVDPNEDIVWHMLENSREGTCSDFVTVFVTMARLAGIPARKVSGYLNGMSTLEGYEVSSTNGAVWAEIHLRSASTGADMGWIPIDPCPQPLEIELVNMTYIPSEWDRDGSVNLTVEGDLVYSSNGTGIDGNVVRAFLALAPSDPEEIAPTDSSMLIETATTTNETGHFIITGVPAEATFPGLQKIVVINSADGYIPPRIHQYPGHINVTDDSVLIHTSSTSIGQGATTDFSGILELENVPELDVSEMANLTVQLDYNSQISGAESLTTDVGKGGTWSFSLTLDSSEPLGPLNFTVSFLGWEDPDESYPGSPIHLRASSIVVNADVTLAPDLQATVEGNVANNSRLLVGNYVYVNGTANSAGMNPTAMDGLLELGIRTNGSGLDYLVVFNQSVNGSFTIAYLLNATFINIPAGDIEVRLRFYPTILDSTDDADLSDDYMLRSYFIFEIYSSQQMRGSDANIAVTVTDHRGVMDGLDLTGTYDHFFDSALVNTSVDPLGNPVPVSWSTLITMLPGDYLFETSFGGSELYEPSSGQVYIRIQGNAELQVSLSSPWIHVGEEGYLLGQLVDEDKNPSGPVTGIGNETELILELLGQEHLREVVIGNGTVNVTNGEFNISFMLPPDLAAGVYVFSIRSIGLLEPPYYVMPRPLNVTVGLESEFALEVVDSEGNLVTGSNVLNAPLSGDLEFGVFAEDIGNHTRVADRTIHAVFDWNGSSQQALPDAVTQTWTVSDGKGGFSNEAGSANFTWTIPGGTAPGTYVMRIFIDDDLAGLISDPNAARWLGNQTFVDVTIQVPSAVVIDWIQPEVTAGAFFSVSGYVEDGDDNTRPFNGPISLKVYFLLDEGEVLISTYNTNATGWFNISSPTDSSLDGVSSGDKTVVVEVVNGSSIYYLPSSEQASIHVTGVSAFVELNHTAPIIITRGETLEVFAKLVESTATCSSCAYDTPIDVRQKNKPVYFLFDEIWLPGQVTNSSGGVGFTYTIPDNQPLGTVVLTLYYNGSNDVHPTTKNLPSTIVRSITILVMDPIVENPIAGGTFDLSGTIESDNGTSLITRNNVPLIAQILITMDGQTVQYLDGQINSNGTWYATVYVDPTTPAGTHQIRAAYNPQVPFYINSSVFDTIDIQGYAVLDFIEPGNLQNDDSKDRGTSVDVVVRVFDNAGQPVPNAMVDVELLTTSESGTLITNASGLGEVTIDIPQDVDPGIYTLYASWIGNIGTVGSIGLNGGNATVNFVVLAHTNLALDTLEGSMIVGDEIWVNGTLLDDVGNPLLDSEGLPAGGLVRLYVDNMPVATGISNGSTGFYSVEYELPEWMSAGAHKLHVEFSGGFIWVIPYANGDAENPEFYWNSSDPTPDLDFNLYVPTEILIVTPQGSQVDRGSDLIINGSLIDIQNRVLSMRTIQVFVGENDGSADYFVATNEYGLFTISLRVPDDQLLGELQITLLFDGDDFNLSSESVSTWYVYSTTTVSVDELSPHTLGDNVTITGTVLDNIENSLSTHQLRILLDGIEIGIINSSEDGTWSFEWVIPIGTNWGEHTIGVRSPNQGYYRESYAETSLFVAHRSALEYDLEQESVVRGETWNISGVLYDADDLSQIGLGNESLDVYLDDLFYGQLTTNSDGTWTYYLPLDMGLERGEHTLLIEFAGTITHVGSSEEVVGTAWSEVDITFNDLSSEYSVRGSDEFPIEIYGEVSEVGGNNYKFDNLSISLRTEDGVLISSELNWTVIGTQLFYLNAIAPTTLMPGNVVLVVEFSGSNDEYLMPKSTNLTILLKVDATFEMTVDSIVLGEREDIYGNITVTADDSNQPLEGISVILILGNESGQLVSRTLITDEFGNAEIILENTPPYSETISFGTVTLEVTSDDSRISNKSLVTLQSKIPESLVYQSIETESGTSGWVWTSLLALVVLAGVGILWYRKRRQDVLDEIASIFSYTAELLAHGDEIRESVFHCYEDLCRVLTKHGYLRRDFETVREFEMALRSALPIRENFLIELDNVFEEARYSRHEMDTQDALRAQSALEGVQGELVRMNVGKGGREELPPEIEA